MMLLAGFGLFVCFVGAAILGVADALEDPWDAEERHRREYRDRTAPGDGR